MRHDDLKHPYYFEKYSKISDYLYSEGIAFEPNTEIRRFARFDKDNWMIYREDAYVFYMKHFSKELATEMKKEFNVDFMIFPNRTDWLMVCFYGI